MSITELAILNLKPPYTTLTDPIPELFKLVGERQAKWSTYPLLFFVPESSKQANGSSSNADDDAATTANVEGGGALSRTTVYLISGWTSVTAHEEWMKSEPNQELLTLFRPYLGEGLLLRHLDFAFDFDKFNVGRLVYTNHTTSNQSGLKEAGEGSVSVLGCGKDFEHPESGLHTLSVPSSMDGGAHLAGGEDRLVLRRVWA